MNGLRLLLEEILLFLAGSPFGYMIGLGLGLSILIGICFFIVWWFGVLEIRKP